MSPSNPQNENLWSSKIWSCPAKPIISSLNHWLSMAKLAPTFDMSACSPHHSHQTLPTILRPTISEVHSAWKVLRCKPKVEGRQNHQTLSANSSIPPCIFFKRPMPWSFRPTLPNFGQTKGHATNETSSACQPQRDSQFKGERLNCASWKTWRSLKHRNKQK